MPKHIVISGTTFWNPGDDFVRDGVIRILRNLFPNETVNLHFYNFNADYFPKDKFSGISNEVSSRDLDRFAPFVDAVVVAGLSAGHEINDLYQWVIRNGLQDRMYLVGAGYENDYVAKHVDQEPAATIFRNARVITGRTKKTPAFMQNLPYHHINCPAILSVENVKQVSAGKEIERVGFSIQLPHEQGVVNHACAQAMYDLAIDLMAELAPQCQIEVIAHHKSEYFHFLNLFEQHNIDLPVVFSSFYQDLHDIYPRYDLVLTTRPHAALFANGFGIPAIIINDTDRHTHYMKGFPHVLQAADKLSFAAALDRIQHWDLCKVAEEAAVFKQQLLAEYVRTLAPVFGVSSTSIADASGLRAARPVGIAHDYKFASEQREQLLVRRLVRPGMTVLDVGANIGEYAKLFSLLTGDKGRVYSFEPSQYAFGRLAEDMQRYGCGNVTLINKAVCAQCGTVTLNEFPEQYCSWNSMGRPQMENPENLEELVPIARSVDVEALTLDVFCRQQKIDHIDYLKLDVEGAELDVLKGVEGLLRRQAIDWIQFEISKKMLEGMGRRAREVFEFLACHGYTCHEITEQGEIGEVVDDSDSFYSNYIAIPSSEHKAQELPVHFFTIVLNGKPFIQYHIEAFRHLPYRWHWHIVEGVAALKHDTAWSVAQGGRITDALHHNGLSNDGTSDYLDRLVAAYPDNITVYRKPRGEFWDGKLEMVNAPLSNIQESCLLWQIDADELWKREQLIQARELFENHPDRSAAYYWCNYFVGERLVTSTRDTYGNNSGYEWLRTWRFNPKCRWTAHEPPRLCTPKSTGDWVDLASLNVLSHQETESAGLIFQHFAYVTEAQLSFKEDYYGYRNAVEQWRSLQSAVFPAALKDYFAWVSDGALVDRCETIGIEPLAVRDGEGQWCFKHASSYESLPRHIMWVRTDAIGDNVIASGMLPALRVRYPDSIITVVCQEHIAELYRNCPYINKVVGFDIRRFTQEPEYKAQLLDALNALQADLVLNSVYSRQPQTDDLCLSIHAAEHIAMSGDVSNMADSTRQENNARYSRLIESVGDHKVELDRHRDFLAGLGIDAPDLQPRVWSNTDDVSFAEGIFAQQGLDTSRTIVCAPGSQWNWKVYPHYAEVLASFTDYDLVVVGGADDAALGDELCASFTGRSINLAGQTSLAQTAELMRRCRLVVSSDSASAHLACAVGVANVVVTGGGHFGRFMPYTPLTAVACLPLDCFGCNWVCPHERRHCIKDIDPIVVIDAIHHQLESAKSRATLFVTAPSAWHPTGSMPVWQLNTHLTQIMGVDARIVSPITGMDTSSPVTAQQAQDANIPKPDPVETLNQQGEQCFLEGNKALARACFIHALELDPGCAITYNNLAVIYWNAGERAQAIQYLAQGMEIDPGDRDLVINGVQMLRDCGEQDKADDLCRSYLTEFPQDDEMRAVLEGTVPSTASTKPAAMRSQSIMAALKAAIGSKSVKRRVLANLERLTPDIYLTRNLEVFRTAIQNGETWFDSPTLLNWYATAFKPATYLEVGVRRGRSMAQVLMGSPECRCFGLDMWIPNYAGVDNPGPEFVLREMRKLRTRKLPVLIEGNSHDTLPAFWENPDNPQLIDLIYIDGDHTYEGAKLDLDLAFQHIASSGVLIFDDIDHSSHAELYPLWNEYKNRYPEYLFIEDHSGTGTACAFKPPFTYLETYLNELQRNPDLLSDAEAVAELIEIGEQLFVTEDYQEAREKFELALSKDPGNADALNNLCVLAWRTGDSDGAMKYLADAITQDCPSKEILENGAQILNDMMCGIEQAEGQDATETKKGQVKNPETALNARKANQQGEALFAAGAIDKAAQAFLAALIADPNSALTHSNLAALFWYLGDQREALRYLAGGIQCPGLFKEIMENGVKILSAIADELDDVAVPAESPSETTTQKQEVVSSTFKQLLTEGESAFNAGDVSRALELFEKARELEPDEPELLNNFMVSYWQLGDVDQAVDFLLKALEVHPKYKTTIINGGELLVALGKHEEAIGLYKGYLNDNPSDEHVRDALGKLGVSMPAQSDAVDRGRSVSIRGELKECQVDLTRFIHALENNLTFPKISVVIPSYNQGKYIEQTLRSVLDQNYPNLELIVMDGGSTDNSVDIIKKYQERISYWQSQSDAGQYWAVNEGFRRSTGEIMTWINSDDKLHLNTLHIMAAAFTQFKDVEWITGIPSVMNEAGGLQWMCHPLPVFSRQNYLQKRYDYPSFIQQEGTFWRRSLWEKAGATLRTDLKMAGDLELWARFFRHAPLHTIDTYTGCFRQQREQKTAKAMDLYRAEADQILDAEIALAEAAKARPIAPVKPIRIVQRNANVVEHSTLRSSIHHQLKSPGEGMSSAAPVFVPGKHLSNFSTMHGRHNTPLVTAIVSTYNSERFICGCIQDLEAQTMADRLEIIVVDSGSEQNEGFHIKTFQKHYPNIRYIRTEQRETIYSAWNRAAKVARGKYITNANTDDRHRPDAFETMVDALEQNKDAALVYADAAVTQEENATPQNAPIEAYFRWPEFDPRNLFAVCYIGPQPMWRADLHKRYGYFDPSCKVAGDYDYWLRLAAHEKFLHIPEVLGLYLNSKGSIEHAFAGVGVQESEQARKQHWPVAWGQRPALGSSYLVPAPESTVGLIASANSGNADDRINMPLVSVIMATKDRPVLVEFALRSLAQQSYTNWEAIVVNDGGADVAEIIARIPFHERIRYISLDKSGGQVRARNHALRAIQGQVVCFLDDDDLYLPNHLDTVVKALRIPGRNFVYTDADLVQEVIKDGVRREVKRWKTPYRHADYSRAKLYADNYIPINSWAFRADCLQDLGGFDESMLCCEDWEFLLRFAKKHDFTHIQKTTVEVHHRADVIDNVTRLRLDDTVAAYQKIFASYSDLNSDPAVLKAREQALDGLHEKLLALHMVDAQAEPARVQRLFNSEAQDTVLSRERDLFRQRCEVGNYRMPRFHVAIIVDTPEQLELIQDTLGTLHHQIYPEWTATVILPKTLSIPKADGGQIDYCCSDDIIAVLQARVAVTGVQWLALVMAGDKLAPTALMRGVDYINLHPNWNFIYTDERRSGEGPDQQCFKPELNIEYLYATNYVAGLCFISPKVLAASTLVSGSVEVISYELCLRTLEAYGKSATGHIPEILLSRSSYADDWARAEKVEAARKTALESHLQRSDIDATVSTGLVSGTLVVEYASPAPQSVTVVIFAGKAVAQLKLVIQNILQKTQYQNYNLHVGLGADVALSLEESSLLSLDRLDSAVTREDYYDHIAREVKTEFVVFLDPAAVVLQPHWLDRLMNPILRNEVGAVGARLISQEGRVLHGGLVTGLGQLGVVGIAHEGLAIDEPGYMQRAQCPQTMSAVSSTCLLIERQAFLDLRGFDRTISVRLFQDIDFCQRLIAQGKDIVWTPSVSHLYLGPDIKSHQGKDAVAVANKDADLIASRWLTNLARDPAYNINFERSDCSFKEETEIPLGWNPDIVDLPRVLGFGVGSYGSWQYRVAQPLSALTRGARAHCANVPFSKAISALPSPAAIEAMQPDVLLMHNTLHDHSMDALEAYKRHNKVTVLFGQDDLMFALPPSNPYSKTVYKDIKKRLRRCLEQADRVVVTTEPLAEALRQMAHDVKVVPNYLHGVIWNDLRSLRRQGSKPRVGWAGAQQHGGDLAMIAEVVRATADEVDWVFFGMCPESIRPYVREFHQGLPFGAYPEKLASLNLDLAIAPLERNRFNEAKSNLRILEYGVLGWPVVASDIYPYQDGPVCRVPNNAAAWIKAIRERAQDIDAAEREGNQLMAWVKSNWMLEDNLDHWLKVFRRDNAAYVDPRISRAGS